MAVVKTYLGAVKPVGEKILLNFVPATRVVAADLPNAEFDFVINQNYYVAGVSMTKTNAALPAAAVGVALAATVALVDSNNNVIDLSQAAFASIIGTPDGVVGQKSIAGMPLPVVAVGAIVSPLAYATASTRNGVTGVPATAAVAGTTNSQQRIRLRISWAGAAANNLDPSCFVEIKLAKYNDLGTQGVAGVLNGIQSSEVLQPVL